MSISRVNPGNWSALEELTKEQISQLDENLTLRLDKRSNNSDTLESDVTCTSGILNIEGDLTIDDPANITLSSGNKCAATVLGDDGPLEMGIGDIEMGDAVVIIAETGDEDKVCKTLKLTGEVTQDSSLLISAGNQFYNYIDDSCTDNGFSISELNSDIRFNGGGILAKTSTNDIVKISGHQKAIGYNLIETRNLFITNQTPIDLNSTLLDVQASSFFTDKNIVYFDLKLKDENSSYNFINDKLYYESVERGDLFEIDVSFDLYGQDLPPNYFFSIMPAVRYGISAFSTPFAAGEGKPFLECLKYRETDSLFSQPIIILPKTNHHTTFIAPLSGNYKFLMALMTNILNEIYDKLILCKNINGNYRVKHYRFNENQA